jgi:hypothetical protein
MRRWLDLAAAAAALLAAVFWFFSAYGELPRTITYWGSTPESDPFRQAIKFSAEMNLSVA